MSLPIDQLETAALTALLTQACGSTRWVQAVLGARPYVTRTAFDRAAEAAFDGLARHDWLEAFSHHPRIGDARNVPAQAEATRGLTRHEQAGAARTSDAVKAALTRGNHDYEARFGHIYLVCATGKTGEELLAILEERLVRDPAVEFAAACDEQRKITRLRLEKLLMQKSPITTHVLDLARGKPAVGVGVRLFHQHEAGEHEVGQGITDGDGRLTTLLPAELRPAPGTYRLSFAVGAYHAGVGEDPFFPEVSITFQVREPGEHFHVPLLLSPFGYSTYRGS